MVSAEPTTTGLARQLAYRLRSRTRWIASSPRERDCGVLCVEHTNEHPHIEVKRSDGIARARWTGLLTCGHIWSCPVCSNNLRAERAERIVRAVEFGGTLGVKVNAGHGLHYTNVQQIAAIDGIVELNIGHAIVAHAIFAGWDNAVREMKAIMVAARLGARA